MDNTATQPSAAVNSGFQQTPPPTEKKDMPAGKQGHGFFSWVGRIFLFLLIGIAFLGGGYYLGVRNNTSSTPTPTPTEATVATIPPTETLPSPTPTSKNTKAVKGGLSGATSFLPYSIDVPTGWTDARETTVAAGIDKLTLTKNGYSVTIYQAPMGGGGCSYKGDKPDQMSQLYTDYAEINGKSGQYRRSWTQTAGQSITYTLCQKTADGSYGVMTIFGAINVVSPNPANSTILTEIDGMLASLIKQ